MEATFAAPQNHMKTVPLKTPASNTLPTSQTSVQMTKKAGVTSRIDSNSLKSPMKFVVNQNMQVSMQTSKQRVRDKAAQIIGFEKFEKSHGKREIRKVTTLDDSICRRSPVIDGDYQKDNSFSIVNIDLLKKKQSQGVNFSHQVSNISTPGSRLP